MTRGRRLRDDIGGIEPAAQAHFEQQIVGGIAREGEKGRGGGDLEEGDGLAAIGLLAFLEQIGELVFG